MDPRRAVDVVGPGHDRLAAGAHGSRRRSSGVVGRDHHAADVRLDRAAPDVNDHRLAGDVGERLARQARRRHAGRDENDGAVDGHPMSEGGKKSQGSALIRVASLRGKACSFPPRSSGDPRSGIGARWTPSNSTRLPARCSGTALGVMALGIIADIIYAPGKPAKPGFVIAVAEGGGEAAAGAPAGGAVQPIAMRLATADVEVRRSLGQGLSRLPHPRQGRSRRRRARTSTAWSAGRRRTWRASSIRRPCSTGARRGSTGRSRNSTSSWSAARLRPGHRDGASPA